MHSGLTMFNDKIIFMGFQSCLKEYKINSNVEYYPNKTSTKLKMPTNFCINVEPLIEESIKDRNDEKADGKKKENIKVEK